MNEKKKRTRQPWGVLRDRFIRARLDGLDVSLAAFAEQEGLDRRSVERHASKEKWITEIERRAQEQQRAIDNHSRRVVERVQLVLKTDEAEVRCRHATGMKELFVLAMRKLKNLSPSDLTVADALAILKFAPAEERKALGLPDKYVQPSMTQRARWQTEAFEAFQRRLANREKAAQAAAELARIIDGEILKKQDVPPASIEPWGINLNS
jgi:hypothetical protein